jgi:Putative lumazine-binding
LQYRNIFFVNIKYQIKTNTPMKFNKFLLTLAALVGISVNTFAQSEDESIKETINNYLEGGAVGDTARLNRAFFSYANLRNLSKEGKVSEMPVKKFIAAVPAGGAKWSSKIVSYSYAGTAATAVTEEELPTFKFVDFLNLLKINGEWKIVSRVYSRVEKTVAVASSNSGGGFSTASSVAPAKGNTPAATAKKPAPKKPSDDGW